jgi:hypothetical protein
MNLILPKSYISYSQASLWNSSKAAYRSRYYLNAPGASNVQQEYGKEIATMLMDDPENPLVAHIPKLPIRDKGFTVEIEGIPVLSYIDSLSLDGVPHFLEYKSAEWKEGKPAWTAKTVSEHMQLKVYSMVIKEKYGAVQDECKLLWLITRMIKHTDQVKVGGKVYEVPLELPQLTGEVKTFPTIVDDSERLRARMWIVQAGHEISADYENYLKNI